MSGQTHAARNHAPRVAANASDTGKLVRSLAVTCGRGFGRMQPTT